MESGFLNRNKSSSNSSLASKIKNIDGKVIVNEDKPLKSILKHTGLMGNTRSFRLPNEAGSGSLGSAGASSCPNSGGTLAMEGCNISSSPLAAGVISDGSVELVGQSGNGASNLNGIPTATPKRHDGESFVDSDFGSPLEDTLNIANNPKVQESFSTNVSNNPGAKVVIPITVVDDMCKKFSNTLYGYFTDQRLAFPMVEDYVKHVWAKFGFQRAILRGSFFFFQFSSQEGLLKVLEGGPWFIRSKPIFLHNWVANTKLVKEAILKVSVWVRLHNLPAVVYSVAGIRLIAERVGRLMRLDEGTYAMCNNPWGLYSYARCLIELSVVHDVLESIEVAIPMPNGKGHYMEYIDVEYEWCPPRCSHCKIFGHEVEACQVLKQKVDSRSKVKVKKKVHNSKAGKKVAQSQQGSRFFKPKSTFIYRPVSKTSSNKVTNVEKPNDPLVSDPPLVTTNDLSQSCNEHGYFKDNINIGDLKCDMEKWMDADKVIDLPSTSGNVEDVGDDPILQINKEISNSPSTESLEGGKVSTNIVSSVGNTSTSGSLWEQFSLSRNASSSDNKSPLPWSEDSDDDEVLMPEILPGGGFLDDMEDYYDGYENQVVLPDKMQAICDQFDIRLNTRRR